MTDFLIPLAIFASIGGGMALAIWSLQRVAGGLRDPFWLNRIGSWSYALAGAFYFTLGISELRDGDLWHGVAWLFFGGVMLSCAGGNRTLVNLPAEAVAGAQLLRADLGKVRRAAWMRTLPRGAILIGYAAFSIATADLLGAFLLVAVGGNWVWRCHREVHQEAAAMPLALAGQTLVVGERKLPLFEVDRERSELRRGVLAVYSAKDAWKDPLVADVRLLGEAELAKLRRAVFGDPTVETVTG